MDGNNANNNATPSITRHVHDNPDSIEIGTPSKGGAVKIYGDFTDPEAFKDKVEKAAEVRAFAQTKLG